MQARLLIIVREAKRARKEEEEEEERGTHFLAFRLPSLVPFLAAAAIAMSVSPGARGGKSLGHLLRLVGRVSVVLFNLWALSIRVAVAGARAHAHTCNHHRQ